MIKFNFQLFLIKLIFKFKIKYYFIRCSFDVTKKLISFETLERYKIAISKILRSLVNVLKKHSIKITLAIRF